MTFSKISIKLIEGIRRFVITRGKLRNDGHVVHTFAANACLNLSYQTPDFDQL